MWLQTLVNDLLDKVANQMKLVTNPVIRARSKHIEVEFHIIRKKVLNDEIEAVDQDLKRMLRKSSPKLFQRQSFKNSKTKLV